MKLKAVIIDDEMNSVDVLTSLIAQYCPTVELAGYANNADSGRELIYSSSPDIVFLDIEMPFGSGFDLLDKLEERNFHLIFITAYDHYALKAIKYSTLDYLLKPVDIDELVKAVNNVIEKVRNQYSSNSIEILRSFLQKEIVQDKIALPTTEGLQFINAHRIIRCEAVGAYTCIYLSQEEKYIASRSLGEYEELLIPYNFLRVHHSHLINLSQIEKYVKANGGYVLMTDGSRVDISNRKKKEFLDRFKV